MDMHHHNVVELTDLLPSDANVVERQTVVRHVLMTTVSSRDRTPVALAGAFVGPDGVVHTSACLIEPEYIPTVVEELSALISRLLAFSRDNERNQAKDSAEVTHL